MNYTREDGSCPFDEWLETIKDDPKGTAQIDKRIAKLRLGLLGEWDDVGEGVIELKFKGAGPGYRIYCGQDGPTLVILLLGGKKKSQRSDINKAKAFWRDYNG